LSINNALTKQLKIKISTAHRLPNYTALSLSPLGPSSSPENTNSSPTRAHCRTYYITANVITNVILFDISPQSNAAAASLHHRMDKGRSFWRTLQTGTLGVREKIHLTLPYPLKLSFELSQRCDVATTSLINAFLLLYNKMV